MANIADSRNADLRPHPPAALTPAHGDAAVSREVSFSDDCHLSEVVADVKADLSRHRTREFLQVVEARKLEADQIELYMLLLLEDYLRDTLDPDAIPTDMHTLGWFAERASDGEYD